MNVLYDRDAKEGLIKEKKVAIIGYGSQGQETPRRLSWASKLKCVYMFMNVYIYRER